jgi:hypothetical protein
MQVESSVKISNFRALLIANRGSGDFVEFPHALRIAQPLVILLRS